ncbi:MAG: 5-(carboxyamino)imidazole ribonucleotide synthase [Rhodobacteraceae bacterium]|jgi:5-(carboxyamino)imidazole ribonucleotide synthase|nr:5-(carboxyamino)imidazole ribonucleotide synthase [Paracoccaceae bacterium]
MSDALPLGSTVGILGGGQLGRMLAMAAARLGYAVRIYDPAPGCPASQVAPCVTAAWDDAAALDAFAAAVDVVTYEFENVPAAALDRLAETRAIRPSRQALRISQDRLPEKEFLTGIGLETAAFAAVASEQDLTAALSRLGCPAILKTRRLGYDGKGQVRITDPSEVPAAWAALAGADAILEGFVPFEHEISVIGARGLDGRVACFDPAENVHRDGILRTSTVPAGVPARIVQDAVLATARILSALDYVGVIGVEFFVAGGRLVVNEIAPRVHNSGHWTEAGCAVDQFEQHIRAITGWPLGDGARHSDVQMENLIGDDIARVPRIAQEADARLHLYGKAEARPGRKMGHVNRIVRRG